MSRLSRRALAQYAVEQLSDGRDAGKLAEELAGTLIESGRADEVGFLLSDIAWELERRGVLANALVESATELNSQLEAEIKAQIKKSTGTKEVILDKKHNSSLIGGLRVETAAKVWDDSVRRKLTDLRESI